MSKKAKVALLPDRGVVRVTGPDAAKLLQGLVTSDMELLDTQPALFAALLSPQGKILFDFLVVRTAGGDFHLETARDRASDLANRLKVYKLRADASIEDASPAFTVTALWDGEPARETRDVWFSDPRLPMLGFRAHVSLTLDWAPGESGAEPAPAEAYHTYRISLGVPEGGKDYAFGDTFPHEALLDQLHGVSFEKGCFVGQEVVSRMEHRGTARKRFVRVTSDDPLPPPGTEVRAGAAAIGRLGSNAGNQGLALLRLDRLAEMTGKGEFIEAAGVRLKAEPPRFATFAL